MSGARTQHAVRSYGRIAFTILLLLLATGAAFSQSRTIDIARQSIADLEPGMDSRNIAVYGISLGMSWGEARNILDKTGIPYIFQKGTSPVVYIPPQRSSYYFVLNPSSYEIIEMGIIGAADLPLENQFLFDAQRWRLTTARTQFFKNEGEFIINEEGESFNFPYQGFVLKYLTPAAFRFVLVVPTNKPLIPKAEPPRYAGRPEPMPPPHAEQALKPVPEQQKEAIEPDAQFAAARDLFEAKKYGSALAIFKKLSEQSSLELLRVRSIYWMGECYFGMKDFGTARKQFERVLKETDIAALREPALKMIDNCRKATKRR
jgi:hypothetical protein